MLGHKGLQHGLFEAVLRHLPPVFHFQLDQLAGVFQLGRKMRFVAQMPATTHHGEVDAGLAALHADRQHVHILVGRGGLHCLLVQDVAECGQLVTHFCGLFEFQLFGMRQHPLLQLLHHVVGGAIEKIAGMSHVLGVVFGRDQAHAGATAALDLVQQAGPRAVGKHRILAGAQAEYFLHQLDGFLHRPGVRVGAEIAVLAVRGATVVGHARIFARLRRVVCARRGGDSRELEIGVALVVAEQDVVARLERLDQVVFEDERFCLGAYHRHFQPGDLAHHEADTRAAMILLEIAGDAPLEVHRLADVQHLIVGIEIAVHARQGGQGGHLGQQFGAVARCGLDQWRVLHRAARN